MQWAKSQAALLSVTFTWRQDLCVSRKTNRLAVPLRLYSQSYRSGWPGAGGIGKRVSPINWVGLSSKQITGRFGSYFAVSNIERPARAHCQSHCHAELLHVAIPATVVDPPPVI